jgi:hypothetical protein
MPTRCTEAARSSGIRNSGRGPAGKPYVWASAVPIEIAPIAKIAKTSMRIRPSWGTVCTHDSFQIASSVPASAGFSDGKQTAPLFPVNSRSRVGAGRVMQNFPPVRQRDRLVKLAAEQHRHPLHMAAALLNDLSRVIALAHAGNYRRIW